MDIANMTYYSVEMHSEVWGNDCLGVFDSKEEALRAIQDKFDNLSDLSDEEASYCVGYYIPEENRWFTKDGEVVSGLYNTVSIVKS